MICPNLNDPEVKAKFDQLLSVVPEYAYYLWDKYEGEVPAKYYNLTEAASLVAGEVRVGVQDLFVSNPELTSIGTPQQYSAYLDTIFPNSKVKDIVYHGTKGERFNEVDFSKNIFGGNVFYVSTDKTEAEGYATKKGNVLSTLINAENIQFQRDAFFGNGPQSKAEIKAEINAISNSKFGLEFIGEQVEVKVFSTLSEATEFSKRNSGWEPLTQSVKQAKLIELNNALINTKEFDTVLTNNDAGERTIYIVNKSKQIHILGNKQDIAGFKKFVASAPVSNVMYSKATLDDIKNHYL